VHPLDRLLHFTKRGGKYTPVTSIDLMRIRAAETGEYAGSDDAVFTTDGLDRGAQLLNTATVTVWRLVQGQRCAFTATARWSEYYPGDQGGHMWRKMPHTMLGKCAEALALRKGFPRQLAGLYASEELDQAERPAPQAIAQRPIAGERENTSAPNVGDSGEVINTTTGEVTDAQEPPPGFYYVSGYSFHDPWHEANLLGYDSQGGALKVSTRTKTGEKLKAAQDANVPIAVEVTMKRGSVGQAYVNKITLLGTGSESF
jgi:hypothetical protein